MDLIDKGSTFQRYGILYENERFWKLTEDGCEITNYILEVDVYRWWWNELNNSLKSINRVKSNIYMK